MKRRQSGAALLLAMIIVTLVATLAAGMVWQQARAVDAESSARARTQAQWIVSGGLDWARLILREDARTGGPTRLGDPWSTPLEELPLSALLAADKSNNADAALNAFLSGRMVDAQSRYNLRNLVDGEGKIVPAELKAFERLCDAAGLPTDVPARLADGLRRAWAATDEDEAAPLAPRRVAQLVWLGLDASTVARLEDYVSLLPVRTPVNVNTASREVLVAAIDGLDPGTAERLVQRRVRSYFKSTDEVRKELPETLQVDDARLDVRSKYFDVYGRVRLEQRMIEEHSLVERRGPGGLDVKVLQRERRTLNAPAT